MAAAIRVRVSCRVFNEIASAKQHITHVVHLAGGVVGVEIVGEADAGLGVVGAPVAHHPRGGGKQTQQAERGLGNVCVRCGWREKTNNQEAYQFRARMRVRLRRCCAVHRFQSCQNYVLFVLKKVFVVNGTAAMGNAGWGFCRHRQVKSSQFSPT